MEEAFLKYIYRSRCCFDETASEVQKIGDGVQSLIRLLLDELGNEHPEFKISKILPVGSYFEKTKVGAPDEFDFMIVLENLSKSGTLTLSKGCTPLFPKLKLAKNKELFNDYMDSKMEYLGNPSLLNYSFWKKISSILKRKTVSINIPSGTILAKEIEYVSRKLVIEYAVKFNTPPPSVPRSDCRELVQIKGITIGVDLMLAIEHPDTNEAVKNVGFPKDFEGYLLENKCHIIAKSCHVDHFGPPCWFITVTMAELDVMRSIDKKHVNCYKILKSLLIGEVNYPGKCMNLSSYMLKTALMFHVYGNEKCLYSRNYLCCINGILDYLKNGFDRLTMPCFLARDMNTWGHVLEVPCFNWNIVPEHMVEKVTEGQMWSLLWVELWYAVIEKTKTLISKDSVSNQTNWLPITDRFEYFKKAIWYLLKEYFNSVRVYKLQNNSKYLNELADDVCLKAYVKEVFPGYLQRMKDQYNFSRYYLTYIVSLIAQLCCG